MAKTLGKMGVVTALTCSTLFIAANYSSFSLMPAHAALSTTGLRAASGAKPHSTATHKATVTLTFIKIADPLESKAFAEMVNAFHKIDGGKWAYVNLQYDAKPFAQLF